MKEMQAILGRLAALEEALNGMFRAGEVVRVDEDKARVKVTFKDGDNMISHWLPVFFKWTKDQEEYEMPSKGEQVGCIFYPFSPEQGFVLGGVYSEKDGPPVASRHKFHKRWPDESFIQHDWHDNLFQIFAKSKAKVEAETRIDLKAPFIHLWLHRLVVHHIDPDLELRFFAETHAGDEPQGGYFTLGDQLEAVANFFDLTVPPTRLLGAGGTGLLAAGGDKLIPAGGA
ncbi:MAG: phage baseplate assembly protein V [Deltaproteobacteria bacterium]|nr:phage baseplate assembly protein V [Deltaproteobacteria bacterium]